MRIDKLKSYCSLVLFAFVILFSSFAQATVGKRYSVDSINQFQKIITSQSKMFSPQDTLVIFDIDHTLLHPKGAVGSSYWFKWQAALLKTREIESQQLAKNATDLGNLTCRLFEVLPFETVESDTTPAFDAIVNQGFPVMLLTARSPQLLHGTLSQLNENGFDILKLSQAPDLPKKINLNSSEMHEAQITKLKNTSYNPKGLMMTNEQDKGVVLRAYLNKAGVHYKNIILIDDGEKNIHSLQAAFKVDSQTAVTTFLYMRDIAKFKGFDTKQQQLAAAEYSQIKPQVDVQKCPAH